MEQYPVPYQVAMIQMASDFLNRKENLAKAEGYIRMEPNLFVCRNPLMLDISAQEFPR